MDRWAVNAIVLSHVNRVFTAASLAASGGGLDPGSIAALLGNLLWAASPYASRDRTEEALMAFAGAITSSVAPSLLVRGDDETRAALSAAEREFFARHDELVDAACEALAAAGLQRSTSCAAVNAFVWEFLFPRLRYGQSLPELAQEIAAQA